VRELGFPHSVCVRSRCARSSTGVEPNDSFGASLNRWHWQTAAGPRVPKTAWMSSQLASFAGTIVSCSISSPAPR
jgi:hypothetical protein